MRGGGSDTRDYHLGGLEGSVMQGKRTLTRNRSTGRRRNGNWSCAL